MTSHSLARAGRRAWRLPLLLLHLALGVLLTLAFLRQGRRGLAPTWPVALWSRWLCRLLGLRVTAIGRPQPGATLFVANHISWLDIIAIATLCPTHFLAKQEVKGWPLIGWFCRRAGTLFIRRGATDGAVTAAEQLVWRLRSGERVLVFPEGTSTDGRQVRRFHARLFQAAVLAGCRVQALAVRYPQADGTINPCAPFVDDDELTTHLWRLLGEAGLTAELHFCPPLSAAGQSRDYLARTTQTQISAIVAGPAPAATAAQP